MGNNTTITTLPTKNVIVEIVEKSLLLNLLFCNFQFSIFNRYLIAIHFKTTDLTYYGLQYRII